MIGINAKKHIQCQKCYCEFESVVGNNSLYTYFLRFFLKKIFNSISLFLGRPNLS